MAMREHRGRHARGLPLAGERALVTGGARGSGRGSAAARAARGADGVSADLPAAEPAMAATRDELVRRGGAASYVIMDVSDVRSIERAVGQVSVERGPIDVLVNNAGIAYAGLFTKQEPEAIARMVSVNLVGAMVLTRYILPGMLERDHGRLLFVSSIQGIAGTPGFVTYSATKGGLIRFAEALSREVRHHRISVTTVIPPAVRTDAFERAKTEAARMMRWSMFPPIPIEQVARRAVGGMLEGAPYVYAGTQSALAALGNRVSQALMGFVLGQAFREEAA